MTRRNVKNTSGRKKTRSKVGKKTSSARTKNNRHIITATQKQLQKLAKRLPNRYYKPLKGNERIQQLKELDRSRKMYRQGKYYTRKKMNSFKTKPSRHVVDFQKCYGISVTSNLDKIERVTGVPVDVIEKILNKGRGAYYSSGSRPNQNAESWARARVASAILKRGAYRVDKHLFNEAGVNKIKGCRRN